MKLLTIFMVAFTIFLMILAFKQNKVIDALLAGITFGIWIRFLLDVLLLIEM